MSENRRKLKIAAAISLTFTGIVVLIFTLMVKRVVTFQRRLSQGHRRRVQQAIGQRACEEFEHLPRIVPGVEPVPTRDRNGAVAVPPG